MKIEATCIDKSGISAEVMVDLDYVFDADELKSWIEQELETWKLSDAGDPKFDIGDYVVTNWNELVTEVESNASAEGDELAEMLGEEMI